MRSPEFSTIFSDSSYKKMVDWINSIFQKGLTVDNNFSGQVIEVSITGGSELRVPHRLKAVPKYRIILRQDADSLIYDGEDWNQNFITLNSASDVNATILLMRG